MVTAGLWYTPPRHRLSHSGEGSIIQWQGAFCPVEGERSDMKGLRAYLPWIGLVMGIGFMLTGCASRKAKPLPPPPGPAAAPSSSFEAKGYAFVFPPAQEPRVWEIKAGVTSGNTESGRLTMERVEAILYRDGQPVLRIAAQQGTADVQGKVARLTLTGGVKAFEPHRHLVLQAERLEWTNTQNKIVARSPRWRGEGMTASADAATFTTDLTEGQFTGHVKTTSAPSH